MPAWLNGKRKTERKHWPKLQVCLFWPAHPPRQSNLSQPLQQEPLPRRRF